MVPSPLAVATEFFGSGASCSCNAAVRPILRPVLGFLFGNAARRSGWRVLFVYSPHGARRLFPGDPVLQHHPGAGAGADHHPGLRAGPAAARSSSPPMICFFPTLVNMVRGLNLPTPNEAAS